MALSREPLRLEPAVARLYYLAGHSLGGGVAKLVAGGGRGGGDVDGTRECAESVCFLCCILPRDVRTLTFCRPMGFPLSH